jgi:hypothetical protein
MSLHHYLLAEKSFVLASFPILNLFSEKIYMKILFTGKLYIVFALLFLYIQPYSLAQTPTDGLMMGKGYLCTVVNYSQGNWQQYWEGPLKRKNENIGTFTSQQFTLMGAYGIGKNLNIIAGLPYVWTKANQGQLAGQRGLQDLSVWMKYRFFRTPITGGKLSVFATGGVSMPTNNYVADFLPMSIGMGSKTASLRSIVYYKMDKGFYLTTQAGYTHRSNIFIDRDAYQYDGKLYYTNEVKLPDMVDVTAKVGFLNNTFQTEFFLDRFTGLSGDDIRRNDMPFPTNMMQATTGGWFGKYTYKTSAGELSTTVQVSHVLNGRNVGQATMFTLGAQYAFQVIKFKTAAIN